MVRPNGRSDSSMYITGMDKMMEVIAQAILAIMIGAMVYIMFWQPKNRIK